ncbi:MAG: LytR family transcriptional protein [Anaerolineaceae bacterium]|nr:MAG: LytR family transcriptional protein [Anaerolineaceae bacterium]
MPEKKVNAHPVIFLRLRLGQIILLAVGLTLAIGGFFFLQNFTACWRLTSDLPGMPPEKCNAPAATGPQSTPEPGTEGTPAATGIFSTPSASAPALDLPPAWDGASRVTVLLIGLDYRDWEIGEGAPRSDTMIVLTIDPVSKTGGILTVPRDLWVNIPGFGYGKINTAYSLGEGNDLPGGGGELARKTVENVIGVPIQHYAQVDFATFEAFIDAVGGVKVEVTEAIELDPIGGGYDHVILQPGRYTLDGRLALAYARNRSTSGNDVDRSARQMQVIMGIRERVINPTYWPGIAANAPTLYQELSAGIKTTMSFDDAFRLGLLAREIPKENIQQGSIDYTMVLIAKSPDGLDILVPLPDKIRELRDQIFTPGEMLTPMAQGEPVALMQAEGARVSILNAAGVTGLAAKTGECLTGQGMNVVHVGDPTEWPASTILIDHSGKPYTLKYLMQLMNVAPNQVRIRFDPNAAADVEIILGPGAVSPCP